MLQENVKELARTSKDGDTKWAAIDGLPEKALLERSWRMDELVCHAGRERGEGGEWVGRMLQALREACTKA